MIRWESRRRIEARRQRLAALTPALIMGRGHSGTRVLAWICEHLGLRMGTDPDRITGDADDIAFTRQIKWVARRSLHITRPEDVPDRLRIVFERALETHYEGRGRPTDLWGWKFPETYLIAPCIHRVLPRARYIHLVRDGRDLAFKHHLTDDPGRRLGRRLLREIGALGLPHHVQAARSWAYQVRHFERFRQQVPDLPVLDLTFEQLIASPVDTTREVCGFLDIPFTSEAERWILDNITRGKIGQFRSEDPDRVAEVEAVIGDTLRAYGYLD